MQQDTAPSDFMHDKVPFPGAADPDSHPRRLQAISLLLGMQPAEINCCRVLDLGCAAGRDLLPMASEFPDSHFVGVDLAGNRIRDASRLATTLDLKNIEFHHATITDVDASWGQFDYILCKGVLTWVEPEVQQHILETFRTNLRPGGVALASYNVFPGWRHSAATRDAMQYFLGRVSDPGNQIERARSLLDFLADATTDDSLQGQSYRHDRDILLRSTDDNVYHDYLTGNNNPIYFHEFHSRLEEHSLQYIGETNFVRNGIGPGSPEVQSVFQRLSFVERCQMSDFLRNESYRKSLVCRQGITIDPDGAPQRLKHLQISLVELPSTLQFDVTSDEPVTFKYSIGSVTVAAPFGKAALHHLIKIYPRTISTHELYLSTKRLLSTTARGRQLVDTCDEEQLAEAMVASMYAGLVEVCSRPPEYLDTLPQKPRVTPLARLMATRSSNVVNQCHQNTRLTKVVAYVLAQLDGTRNRDDLVRSLRQAFQSGELANEEDANSPEEQVDTALDQICDYRFLAP
ncbi:MAG: class I SAM-dependent methyltransferase [Pirellulaceae bacterium]|nr:class I SAM-dependent methyltransferase [Pirellulaceae bacterium]HJN13541.1 class I SAM-dependent methyltransferase [Pirellulaceae bacterium]